MENTFEDLGFAKLDMSRQKRTGVNETIYCPGKTTEQLIEILKTFHNNKCSVLGTRCSEEKFLAAKQANIPVTFDAVSKIIKLINTAPGPLPGKIAVCTGGTADLSVAEEAAQTAEFFGAEVERYFDVGIAGIHRLFAKLDNIRSADIVIAVAGMEGALGSVITGLIDSPVIAVPTSVGYGASFNGIAPLLTMLNSCAEGMSVVNIDNGFGAGMLACRMLRRIGKTHD